MIAVVETLPFTTWLNSLKDLTGRERIAARILRISRTGNFGEHKEIGGGVGELRFHFGPGYRVYFCRRASEIVILLGGGDKGSQARDIKAAIALAKEV